MYSRMLCLFSQQRQGPLFICRALLLILSLVLAVFFSYNGSLDLIEISRGPSNKHISVIH